MPQGGDVVQNPEAAPVGRDRKVVVLHDQVADRGRGKVQTERLPVVAIVVGEVDAAFRAGKEQPAALRVFPHHVDVLVPRDAVGDFLPGLAVVACPVNVRAQIVEPDRVYRRVGAFRIEMARVH